LEQVDCFKFIPKYKSKKYAGLRIKFDSNTKNFVNKFRENLDDVDLKLIDQISPDILAPNEFYSNRDIHYSLENRDENHLSDLVSPIPYNNNIRSLIYIDNRDLDYRMPSHENLKRNSSSMEEEKQTKETPDVSFLFY
jgi:hypothetical protein